MNMGRYIMLWSREAVHILGNGGRIISLILWDAVIEELRKTFEGSN